MRPKSEQFLPPIKPLDMGENAPDIQFGFGDETPSGVKIEAGKIYPFLGPTGDRMRVVAEGGRQEERDFGPGSGTRSAHRVPGKEWRLTDTKEGRRALAGDLGLPNTKRKKKK